MNEEFVKNWLYKLDKEPRLDGHITNAGWVLLKEHLDPKTYNDIITQLKSKIDGKKEEINKQIQDTMDNLGSNKIK